MSRASDDSARAHPALVFAKGLPATCFAVVFSSVRTEGDDEGYGAMAARMVELGMSMPGFLGIESARGADGFGITVSYWATESAIRDWQRHVEHLEAQRLGRERWYAGFELRICRVERSRGFRAASASSSSRAAALGPKAVVESWIEAFNRADVDALASMYAPDATNHQVAESPVVGREAIRAMFRTGFANAEMVCIRENLFEDGEWAILEWRDPKGLRGCGFFHVVDGSIAFQRGYWDKLSFLRSQGLPLRD